MNDGGRFIPSPAVRAWLALLLSPLACLAAEVQGEVPPVIFFPGIPSLLIPNPMADARPGYLGVELDVDGDDFADDAKKNPAKKNAGVGILDVVGDSPAAKAGLKAGDHVLSIEGRETKTSTQLHDLIRAAKPEHVVKLAVRRDGKEIEIKAKLAVAPDAVAGAQVLQLNGNIVLGGMNAAGNEPQAVPGVVAFNRNSANLRGATSTSARNNRSATGDKDAVTLRDGNRFLGKITGIVPAKGLLLKRDGAPDLELIEEEITGLTFAERAESDPAPATGNGSAKPKVLLQLRDGSAFHGDALTMERGSLLLTLRGRQRIEIPREHVQSVTLSDERGVQIYDGPTSLTGWTSGRYAQGQWEFKDGLLRCFSNGPIGRDLGQIPDPLDMSFDVVFPRQMQHFGVLLFANGVNESGVGGLSLQFSPNQIYGSHYDGKRSNQYNTPVAQNDRVNFSDKAETVHYRLLVDRVKGSALIYINGVKRADWKLSKVKPEDLGLCGATFSLTPHVSMSGATFTIGRVRILPWNGKPPEGSAELPAPKGDQVLTGDGATTDGSLSRITDGEIVFANPAAAVRRDRTLFVRFATPDAQKDFPAAAAMVRMKNGSEFAATQVRGNGETFTLGTRFGREIALPLAALREMEFLPRAGQGKLSTKRLDVLTFTDGTQLRGRALTPITGDSVRWKIAASNAPLEYPPAKVAGVFFSHADEAQKTPPLKGDNAVRLGNGDWLPGDAVSLDGTRLVLKTEFTPGLNIPLSDLRGIFLNPDAAATLADGATGADLWSEGWVPNRISQTRQRLETAAAAAQPWMYHDGGYTLTGLQPGSQPALARRWPAYAGAYALNFECISPGRSVYFTVQLYNSKDEHTFTVSISGGRVYVYFNPGSARQNRFVGGGKRFQIEDKIASGGDATRISIVLDRPAKTFRVLIAGKEIGKIPFKDDEAKEALDACGMSFTQNFYSTSGGRQSRLSRIWLAPWSGAPETAFATAEKKEAPAAAPGGNAFDDAYTSAEKEKRLAADAAQKKDPAPAGGGKAAAAPSPTIYLVNGDEFPGAIGSLTADRITVESEAGPLELPGKRVAWIHFPGTVATPAHFPRLRFYDRGLLSVTDLRVGSDRVQCTTLQGQPLEFPLGIVKEIVWRALDEK